MTARLPIPGRRSPMFALGVIAALCAAPARAEEGMWTFDNFPVRTVNTAYGVNIDQAWLDRVRGASVRLSGCSGSIVSPDGLVLTNAHCVLSCAQDLSSADEDHAAEGWSPATREEERACPGQTAEVLLDIVDVTDRIQGAGKGLEGAAYYQAWGAVEGQINDEYCGGDPTLTCQVVSFYRGGRYALYKYRTYRDVRLAFTPDYQSAFFGGDPDNFNFPRYSLDFAFLRLYEDEKPLATPGHLRWNPSAPREGEPTFVVGNPGSTQRWMTVSQLERMRDQQLPILISQMAEMRGRLAQFGADDEEQSRVSRDSLDMIQNNYKVFYGQQQTLLDEAFMARKRAEEEALRAAVAADPALAEVTGDPWAELADVQVRARALFPAFRQLEASAGAGSMLFSYARTIVRVVTERAKPAEERRFGYSDAELAAIGLKLAADMPVEREIERIDLAFWLSKTRELLTVDDANVQGLLGSESPEGLARRLVDETRLDEAEYRAELLAMTPRELAATEDAMIQFALANDTAARLIRTQWELGVAAPATLASERIARARFALHGDDQYPDATFTLRLSYGKVAGWTWRGRTVAPFTRFAGLYQRATGSAPFELAPRWRNAKGVDQQTVMAFVTTNDIIGGNSGSPVLNGRGEVIGAAFDGNIHSIGGAFGYDGDVNRTVVLSTAAMTEALREVYDQPRLLAELGVR